MSETHKVGSLARTEHIESWRGNHGAFPLSEHDPFGRVIEDDGMVTVYMSQPSRK